MPLRFARTKDMVIILGVALLAAAVAGGLVWVYQQRTIDRLEAEARSRQRRLEAVADRLESLRERLDGAMASSSTASVADTAASPGTTPGTSKPSSSASQSVPVETSTQKEFAYITKVLTSGDRTTIVADFAQLLTGPAAAKAASERGDESPPPNDYYIVNDNPKLRSLPVSAEANVKLTTTSEGTTVGPGGYELTLAQFASAYATTSALQTAPYYLTLRGGRVTAIAEVYLP